MTTLELNNDDIFLKDANTNLYKCTTCSYYTPLKNSFIKHLKTDKHKLNVNPLECKDCKNLFHTKLSFNNHVIICTTQDTIQDTTQDTIQDTTQDTTQDKNNIGYDSTYENDIYVDVDNISQQDDSDQAEDLGLLLRKFGNEYEKLMIKYILLFFFKIKENILPVNILLIFVLFMWGR